MEKVKFTKRAVDPKQMLTVDQAMAALKCSRVRIVSLVQDGKLRAVSMPNGTGKQVLISRASVNAIAIADFATNNHRAG